MATVIPAQLLYIAAQCASQDDYKDRMTYINIKKIEDQIQICSTDGHRAFRVSVPINEHYYMAEEEINISAKSVKKRVAKARYAQIRDNVVEYKDVNGSFLVINPTEQKSIDFPGVNHVWPTTYHNDPNQPIAFNSRLLSEFLVEVSRYGVNGVVKMETNKDHQPLQFTSKVEMFSDTFGVEFLLMPVQIRSINW